MYKTLSRNIQRGLEMSRKSNGDHLSRKQRIKLQTEADDRRIERQIQRDRNKIRDEGYRRRLGGWTARRFDACNAKMSIKCYKCGLGTKPQTAVTFAHQFAQGNCESQLIVLKRRNQCPTCRNEGNTIYINLGKTQITFGSKR
ncbi:hypothetical protein OAJ77_00855 [Rhodospirillales bacterium]|nr:hypothetical protein [Rhodospirillales bacterium]